MSQMSAIEIKGLSKSFRGIMAVNDLTLTVPKGAIYGFIGENGSGKSTTEKLICGLLNPNQGEIKIYGKDYQDSDVRSKMGVLIEAPACFPNSTIYQNLMMQALNLGIKNPREEIMRVLEIVRMSGAAHRKFKQCSLGMKQRIGLAQSLLGNPELLILDEPINGLDADGMRIVREVLLELKDQGITVFISSHILGELEKIATHYGVIKNGRLIKELSAEDMNRECRSYVFVKTNQNEMAYQYLKEKYHDIVKQDEGIIIYDESESEVVAEYLFEHRIMVKEISFNHIGLEAYYLTIMSKKGNQ